MRLRILLIAGIAGLTGCATTPIFSGAAQDVPPERIYASELTTASSDRGLLVVTRDKGMMGSACAARLYVDGTHVADLRMREQVRLYVATGEHIAGVSTQGGICGGGTDQTAINVTLDRPAKLRIASGQEGDVKIEPSAF